MEPKAQSLLLRFLEAGTFVRVGGLHPVKTDVRIIAATNLPLSELDKRRLVRPDLLYRINCISVEIPPLRERPEDIRLIGEYCLRGDLGFAGTVDAEIWQILQQREWPGNVRELRNVLLRSILGCADNRLTADQFLPVEPNPLSRDKKFRSADQLSADVSDDIDAVLHETNGNVREAARRLGIHWTTLYRRLAKEKAH
jgi:transcriptional regulator with PAS, ATPase and Fis domain